MFQHFLSLLYVLLTFITVSTSHVSSEMVVASESPTQPLHSALEYIFEETETETEKKCSRVSIQDKEQIPFITHWYLTDYFLFLFKHVY